MPRPVARRTSFRCAAHQIPDRRRRQDIRPQGTDRSRHQIRRPCSRSNSRAGEAVAVTAAGHQPALPRRATASAVELVGTSGDNPMQPQKSGTVERLDYIDSLRGVALFGVFGANLFIFFGLYYMTDAERAALPTAALDRTVQFLELVFIETKFMGLFALLFGVSFWLFLSSVRARGFEGTATFYRRIFWLFVIGLIHGWLLWCFDILRFYALWAVMLPLFLRVSPRTLFAWAIGCAIFAPAVVSGVRSEMVWGHLIDTAYANAVALQGFSSPDYGRMLHANWLYDWYLTLSFGQIGY